MNSKQVVVAVAAFAVLAAAFFVWRRSSGPAVNLRPSTAAGEVLADEVGRLLGSAGKVVIIGREVSRQGLDATGECVASFTAALQRRPNLKLAATEWIPRSPAAIMDMGAISSEQLLAVAGKNPDARVLVVFAGLPPYSAQLANELTARSVKLVAVCGYGPTVRRWLESKSLAVAAVPRFDSPPADAPKPKTAREWFEREFQLVTPENVASLPY